MNATRFRQLIFFVACVFFTPVGLGLVVSWGSEPPASAALEDTKTPAELVARAVELDRKRDHGNALKLYNEALRLDASNVDAYFRRGLIHLVTGQSEKALADSEKVIQLSPLSGHGYWLRAAAYGGSGEIDKAYADYDKAIRLNPQLAEAYYGRGLVHQSRGDLDKAIPDFDRAIDLTPENPAFYAARSKAYAALGQGEPARPIDGQAGRLINVSNNSGRSIHPAITNGREGDIHLVWMDDSPGNFDIFYSNWNGENWTRPANLSNNPTLSMYPTVAMDLEGQVHVTWMDGEHEGEMHVLHSKRFDSNWSTPKNVSKAKGVSQRPQIAVDSSGVVHLVWYGNQGDFFELYHCQLVDSKWTNPSNTELVEWYITHNPGWSRKPALSAGADGSVHVVWVGMEDVPSPYALTQNIRHSQWAGNTWSRPGNVSQKKDMTANLEDPTMVVDDKGNLHVVWEDRGRVWYGQFDGKEWSAPRQFSPAGLESALPTVCYSEAGTRYFAWLGVPKGEAQVFYRRLTGEQWSDSVNVSASPGTAFGCTLALDRSGQLHMVWMDDRIGEFEIIHRRLMPHN